MTPDYGFTNLVLKKEFDEIHSEMTLKYGNYQLPTPSYLYHYTTLEGLKGILTGRSFWASLIQYLNDEQEYQYFCLLFKDALMKTYQKNDKLSIVQKELKEYFVRELDRYFSSAFGTVNTYSICFCEDSDSLSMWRSYGNAIGGYALCFDTTKLEQSIKTSDIGYDAQAERVEYSEAIQKDSLVFFISKTLEKIDSIGNLKIGDMNQLINAIVRISVNLAYRFKNPAFSIEKEWRFSTFSIGDNELGSFKFRSTNRGLLIPYKEIGFFPEACLRKVVVGPNPNMELAVNSTYMFLKSLGYNECVVVPSQVKLAY